MKKRIAAAFAAALVLSMAACGGQETGAGTAAETAEMQETEAQETEAQETEEAHARRVAPGRRGRAVPDRAAETTAVPAAGEALTTSPPTRNSRP